MGAVGAVDLFQPIRGPGIWGEFSSRLGRSFKVPLGVENRGDHVGPTLASGNLLFCVVLPCNLGISLYDSRCNICYIDYIYIGLVYIYIYMLAPPPQGLLFEIKTCFQRKVCTSEFVR